MAPLRDPALYGISRVDSTKKSQHGWQVTIGRHRAKHTRFFADLLYGGQQRALREAQRYRDEVASKPMISRREYASIVRRNNNSGFPGVCRTNQLDRQGRPREYWLAFWPKESGGTGRAKFSIAKYGETLAFQLAHSARQEAVSRLEGPHLTFDVQHEWLAGRSLLANRHGSFLLSCEKLSPLHLELQNVAAEQSLPLPEGEAYLATSSLADSRTALEAAEA